MKIIKDGKKKQKGWAKEFICTGKGLGGGGCSAKLLVEQGDLFQSYHSYMGREEEWNVAFACSCCGVITEIEGYPGNVRELPK